MATGASYDQLLDWMVRFDEHVIEQRAYLTELDSAIGDGDHGSNLARGMAAASAKVDAEQPKYLDDLFRAVGMALVSAVGGASGPLFGTFFLRFGVAAGHTSDITTDELATALEAGLGGVVERGKAEVGDKTMVDAMEPAVRAFRSAVGEGALAAAQLASNRAHKGREGTADLIGRKGRASYLGERAIGHIDPGATSTALLFQALFEALA